MEFRVQSSCASLRTAKDIPAVSRASFASQIQGSVGMSAHICHVLCSISVSVQTDQYCRVLSQWSTLLSPVATIIVLLAATDVALHSPANFIQFLKALRVKTAASEMTFGISRDAGAFECSGTSGSSLLPQPSHALKPSFWRMIFDFIRFNQFALDLLSLHPVPLPPLLPRK